MRFPLFVSLYVFVLFSTHFQPKSPFDEGLFPLDCCRRFGGDIVHNAVNSLHFVHNGVGNFRKEFVRQANPIGAHRIGAFHGT